MQSIAPSISVGDDVVIIGGAFAGERGVVVAIDGEQVTVELVLSGRETRMAFDASALSVRSPDPRATFRVELERYYAHAAREDMIRWFSERDEGEDLLEIDDLASLYQIASPMRREYLRIVDELDEAFSDAASMSETPEALRTRWSSLKVGWFARIAPPSISDDARARALALMERVRAAAPADDDAER